MTTRSNRSSTERTRGSSDSSVSGTHVVLGTGQVGHAVAQYLCTQDVDVRVVNQSGKVPGGINSDVEAVSADISKAEAAYIACEGGAVVYFCVQPPYHPWSELFPVLLDRALNAAAEADAKFVAADNLYGYGRVSGPIHESFPMTAVTETGRTRAEMVETILTAHADGQLRATIGRGSDFYGPGVTNSVVGRQVIPQVLDGGTVWFPGDPDQPHTYTYIHDFARALVMLGTQEAALGEVWHVPNHDTRTTRQFVKLAADIVGTEPTVRTLPSWVVNSLGLVSPTFEQLRDTKYQRTEPLIVNHDKFKTSFEFEPTPHRRALKRTIAWYQTSY